MYAASKNGKAIHVIDKIPRDGRKEKLGYHHICVTKQGSKKTKGLPCSQVCS